MERWKSRTPLDYINPCVWAWAGSSWEIFSFLTWTSGSAWELISSVSKIVCLHTLGFPLFIPHCDSGKNFTALFSFVFHLHALLAWMIFAWLERNILGETYRIMWRIFPEVHSEASQRKLESLSKHCVTWVFRNVTAASFLGEEDTSVQGTLNEKKKSRERQDIKVIWVFGRRKTQSTILLSLKKPKGQR